MAVFLLVLAVTAWRATRIAPLIGVGVLSAGGAIFELFIVNAQTRVYGGGTVASYDVVAGAEKLIALAFALAFVVVAVWVGVKASRQQSGVCPECSARMPRSARHCPTCGSEQVG